MFLSQDGDVFMMRVFQGKETLRADASVFMHRTMSREKRPAQGLCMFSITQGAEFNCTMDQSLATKVRFLPVSTN